MATDFPDFYCAAHMLVQNRGHQLYDAALQRQYQAHYAGRVGTLYIHPPFEAVFYLAVAWLPLRRAYLLWFLLNVAFLAVGLRRLANEALLPWDWHAGLAASLTFVPALLCFLQGQDSLLLLLFVILAFTAFRREGAFAAGCWLGLGLFKFQLVLPLVFVLALTQNKHARSGLAKGFGMVTMALAGFSAAICGWSVFLVYPKFLTHLQAQAFAGVTPRAMANFRGLIYFFFQRDQSPWAIGVLSLLSAAGLTATLACWKQERHASQVGLSSNPRRDFDRAFAVTVMFALLVSYHLNPHDLSLLLLPMALLLRGGAGTTPPRTHSVARAPIALCALLFLPPLHLLALRAHSYALVAILLIALFAVSAGRRDSSCT